MFTTVSVAANGTDRSLRIQDYSQVEPAWTKSLSAFNSWHKTASQFDTTELERLVCCREWLRHMLPEGVRHMLEQATEKSAILLNDYEARRVALQPIKGSVVKGGINYTPTKTCWTA